MSGTIVTPSSLMTNEIVDNTSGAITPGRVRDIVESAFSLVISAAGVQTANYTAVLTDRGTIVPFNASSAVTYTIPPHSSVALPVGAMLGLVWVSGAVGQPSFAAGAGVTIVSPSGNLSARAAGAILWAWQYVQDTWYLSGDLT